MLSLACLLAGRLAGCCEHLQELRGIANDMQRACDFFFSCAIIMSLRLMLLKSHDHATGNH